LINSVAPEISQACQVLFGPNTKVSADFLHTLNFPALKSAFKKRALETHPDRARVLNQDVAKLNERFKLVSDAYDRLHSILDRKPDIRRKQGSSAYPNNKPAYKTGFSDHFYKGKMPTWPLLLGRYLYYSSRISWDVLIEAITWQRRQRPSLGRMALQAGLVSQSEIVQIIRNRKVGEQFGECAVRLGLVKASQMERLIKQQSRLQKPIGTYFVDKGLLSAAELPQILKAQYLHNHKNRYK